MLHKITNLIVVLLICSCSAAYKPFFVDMKVPDGPPEYMAGWHDGCASSLSNGSFYNARSKFDLTFGNGIYQHDPVYQTAFSWGFNTCQISNGSGFGTHPYTNAPLEK